LNFIVNVSVDSIVKETYESIRVGSSLDTVLENSRYFGEVMRKRGFPFIWRCCVMRQNWREMPDMLRYCNDNGIRVLFNQVDFPLRFSLHTLPPADLREVVAYLRRADVADVPDGGETVQAFNQQQYRGLVGRLEAFIDPAHWGNALASRLENATSNPMLNRVSIQGISGRSGAQGDDLAERVSTYVATRLTIEQATSTMADDIVPPAAREDLARLCAAVGRFRSEVPTGEFLRIFLSVAVRTYVKITGVTPQHNVALFDRITPLVEAVMQRSDRERLVDAIIASPLNAVYRHVAGSAPPESIRWDSAPIA
jgi:hypothetical protein